MMGDLLAAVLHDRPALTAVRPLAGGGQVEEWDQGVWCFTPAAPSQFDLVLSAGVHGNETAPVELLDQLGQALLDGSQPLRCRLLLILGNPAALRQGVRYLDEDMNRQFGAQPGGGRDAQRAHALRQHIQRFFADGAPTALRVHYDLHTAIRGSLIEQFALCAAPDPAEARFDPLAWLAAAGMRAALLYQRSAPTLTAWTHSQHHAHAATLELGKARPFGHNQAIDLSQLAQQLRHWLASPTLPAAPNTTPPPMPCFRVARDIPRLSDAFRLHLAADTANFTPLHPGQLLAEDGDTRYVIDEQDARVIFPNPNVANGQRAGLVIVPW